MVLGFASAEPVNHGDGGMFAKVMDRNLVEKRHWKRNEDENYQCAE